MFFGVTNRNNMLNTRLLNLITLCILLVLSVSVNAQSEKVPTDPSFKIGKLPNGLTYYIVKNSKPEKRVELRLAVNAGAVQEDDDQLGMAHLVEHMCFNGTENFPKNDLIHYLQSVGVGFGSGINGYTSFDETVYKLTVPSDSADILDNGILVMADWASRVTFDSVEIEKERGVVLEEWRLRLGANQRMLNEYIPVLLKDSKYAERLPIGTKESILGTTQERIKQFYTDWYRPDLMAFIVVGDIDPDSIEQKIIAQFSHIKSPETIREIEVYPVKDNDEPLTCVVSDKENTYSHIRIAYKTDLRGKTSYNDYRNLITSNMFNSMLRQRFREKSQLADPPFKYASAYYGNLWVRSREAFQLSISVTEDGFEKGMKAALTEVERVKQYGFIESELERIKKDFLKGAEKSYNERDKQYSRNIVNACVDHFLHGNAHTGIEFYYEFLKDNIDDIKLEDINQLANKFISDKNIVAIATGIEKEGITLPTEQDLKDYLAWSKTIKVEPYTEEKIAENLITKMPKGGKVVSQKEIPNTGITEYELSNGVKVALKPTTFKNDEIKMSAFSEGGQSLFGTEYKLSARFASGIVKEGGVHEYSKIELGKMLAGKNAWASPYIGGIYSGISGGSSVADFETMMQLTYLYFTSPRGSNDAYESYVTKAKSNYKNTLSNPRNYFFNQVRLIKYDNNPDAPGVFPSDKDWENLSMDKIMEVYTKSFSNASNFTFLFVGSFNNDSILPKIEQYLGNLPSTDQKQTYADKGFRPNNKPRNETIKKGSDPKAMVLLQMYDSCENWTKNESHLMWSLSNIIRRIYTDSLREEMSGVYGFGLGADVTCLPYNNYYFNVTIPCDPEMADSLSDAAIAVIERIKTEGITNAEFEKEIKSQKRTTETDLKENRWWMFAMNRIYQFEGDFGRVEKPYELCNYITPELLQETAKKYLDTSKIVRFNWYPEEVIETSEKVKE